MCTIIAIVCQYLFEQPSVHTLCVGQIGVAVKSQSVLVDLQNKALDLSYV
jgi:hypothetical protein